MKLKFLIMMTRLQNVKENTDMNIDRHRYRHTYACMHTPTHSDTQTHIDTHIQIDGYKHIATDTPDIHMAHTSI